MQTKISQLRRAALIGDWQKALSIAARFPRLGEHQKAIMRAHECMAHPGFYRQLGHDEAAMIEAGKAALRDRFGL